MNGRVRLVRHLAAVLTLALLTLAALGPVLRNGFVNFDDGTYVTENPRVLDGITPESVAWAATTGHAANWHPLTWLSHMADVQLFDLDARGHHVTSLLLHLASGLLLYAALSGMTGARLRSFFVAALFAVHPLHVESVAWISERKDVLCAFFWMATLVAYHRYARRPRAGTYLLAAGLFAAALLSKPMAVTLPFVLLLLDFWPLGRLSVRRAIVEKAPLLALAAAAAAGAYLAQQAGGALRGLERYPLAQRLSEPLLSYAAYLGKTLWPQGLSVIYTVADRDWPGGRGFAALVLLAALSVVAVRVVRRCPAAFVGWCWYIGTLVPVIGFVKVGAQAMADRYTYLPIVGLFVALVWGSAALVEGRSHRQALLGALGGGVLLACVPLSRTQAGHWRDSVSLFGHALAVAQDNWAAHHLYALAVAKEGRYAEAVDHALVALRGSPRLEQLGKLGDFFEARGRDGETAALYAGALRLYPDFAEARYRLANALVKLGRYGEAIREYRVVIAARPGHGHAHNNLGIALFATGDAEGAVAHYREALRADPRNAEAHNNLGLALSRLGRPGEAETHYREAVRVKPTYATAIRNLSGLLHDRGRADEAAGWRRRAAEVEARDRSERERLEKFHRR